MDIQVTNEEFQGLAGFIRDTTGIVLEPGKMYLVETRIGPLLKQYNCGSYTELNHKARHGGLHTVGAAIIDAITTHETSFFRDRKPFDIIKTKLVPDLLSKDPGRQVSIWSAACSTGQEAYSVGISLKESLLDVTKYRIQILGTDISRAAVDRASQGEFSSFEVSRGLYSHQLKQHFVEHEDRYQIHPDIRSITQFRAANLMEINTFGPFDIILCRNVAIYFHLLERKRLFSRLEKMLKPGGVLILGSTETLAGVSETFRRQEYQGVAYYQLA